MKHALLSLFFFFGLALVQLQAQSCQPCPPGCCAQACKKDGAAQKTCTAEAAAKCTPAELEACKAAGKANCADKKSGKSAATTPKSKSPAVQTVSVQPADRQKKSEGEM